MMHTDGYKLDHRRQYPEGTQYVYSNWTARGSRVDGVEEVHDLHVWTLTSGMDVARPISARARSIACSSNPSWVARLPS